MAEQGIFPERRALIDDEVGTEAGGGFFERVERVQLLDLGKRGEADDGGALEARIVGKGSALPGQSQGLDAQLF